jgi:hypothetical protein
VADPPKAKSGLLSGNKKYVVIGGGLAAAYAIYKYEKGKSSTAATASTSTSTACTCDDGSTPSSAGICADGTTCGAAGSNTAPAGAATGGSSGVGSQGQGMPCVVASGQTGIVDFNGNCVAITTPPVGKGPVKAKAPTSCPKGQRLISGKCTTSCPPGYSRLTKTSDCTKTKAKKPAPKPPAKKPVKKGGPQPKVATAVGTQDAATTNRPAGGGSLVHGDTA